MNKFKYIIIPLFVSLVFITQSCKIKEYVEVPVEVEKVKIEYVHKLDSIYLHDSVATYIMQRGDTVFVDRYKYKIKEVYRTDTIHKIDSIPKVVQVKVKEVVEVNKLNFIQKILMWAGGVGILLILGFLICKFKVWKLLF